MASVERAMAMAAAALLPGLLPTPPMNTMITKPCIIILPAASNPKFPKPGRADAVERWDAHKIDGKEHGSPSSSSGSTSPGRADSVERWDINKKKNYATPSISSSTSSSSMYDDSNKRPPSRADSADRWDAHKKPRAAAQSDPDAEQEERKKTIVDKEAPEDETTSKKMIATAARTHPAVFSGPTFVASPEPSMLPMPAFFPRRAGVLPLPAFVQAH